VLRRRKKPKQELAYLTSRWDWHGRSSQGVYWQYGGGRLSIHELFGPSWLLSTANAGADSPGIPSGRPSISWQEKFAAGTWAPAEGESCAVCLLCYSKFEIMAYRPTCSRDSTVTTDILAWEQKARVTCFWSSFDIFACGLYWSPVPLSWLCTSMGFFVRKPPFATGDRVLVASPCTQWTWEGVVQCETRQSIVGCAAKLQHRAPLAYTCASWRVLYQTLVRWADQVT